MTDNDDAILPFAASGDLARAWARASGHALNSVLQANRATFAAFGLSKRPAVTDADDTGDAGRDADCRFAPDEEIAGPADLPPGVDADWTVSKSVASPDGVAVGDLASVTKTLDDDDVRAFARASADTNPLHLDDEFAAETRFGGRIVHGTLLAGLVSAALARLPGVVVYLSQTAEFRDPVEPGREVSAVVEVAEALGDGRYRVETRVYDDAGRAVVDGEAAVLVDPHPAAEGDPENARE